MHCEQGLADAVREINLEYSCSRWQNEAVIELETYSYSKKATKYTMPINRLSGLNIASIPFSVVFSTYWSFYATLKV